MCRGYLITGVSRRYFLVGGMQPRVWAVLLLRSQDVECSSPCLPILRDTQKGNTQDTAGNEMAIFFIAPIFYSVTAMKKH